MEPLPTLISMSRLFEKVQEKITNYIIKVMAVNASVGVCF